MSGEVDLNQADKVPFVIDNQVFVLGNPVISTNTLSQLVQVLDDLGQGQPIVIISPEANSVPNFDTMVSGLIQNNRKVVQANVTSTDKYAFKDATPAELEQMVATAAASNPAVDPVGLLNLYQGLKARAEALFRYDQCCLERDGLWQFHCANPESTEGSERYSYLHYTLIPQALAEYQAICAQLEVEEAKYQKSQREHVKNNPAPVAPVVSPVSTSVAATSSVSYVNNYTPKVAATVAAVPENSGLTNAGSVTSEGWEPPIWSPWLSVKWLKMPLKQAFAQANSPAYEGLRAQQRDVEFEGVRYKAVHPGYLLALGIPVYPDGLPIVYTELGKFKRVGISNVPYSKVSYWYPEPTID